VKIASSWNSILVDQFIELREVEKASFSSAFDKTLELISIITDTDLEEIEEMSYKEVVKIEKQIQWLYSEPKKGIVKDIGEYKFKGFDSLTLAEFIDLSHFFAENFIKNLPLICAILYRKTKLNEWKEEIIEPYDYDTQKRGLIFMETPICSVYGIISEFIKFKEVFEDTYYILFKPDLSDEPIDDLDDETKKDIEEEEQLDLFSWERLIYSLCDGDLTKTDKVLELNLTYCFNMLSMKKAFDI
jgi:hypothetical protein